MSSSWHSLFVHLIWSTSERRAIIADSFEMQLHAALAAKGLELGCRPLAVGGVADHVHFLAGYPPSLPVSELVRQLKGVTSHLVNHQWAPGAGFRWQGGYGAFSVSADSIDNIRRYVLEQRIRHARHDLRNDLESTW